MAGYPFYHRKNTRRPGEDRVLTDRILPELRSCDRIPETMGDETVRASWVASKYKAYKGPYIKGGYLYIPKRVLAMIDRALPLHKTLEHGDPIVCVYAWSPGTTPTIRIAPAEATDSNGKPLHALIVKRSSHMADKIFVHTFAKEYGIEEGAYGVAYAVVNALPRLKDRNGTITQKKEAKSGKITAIEIDFTPKATE